MKFIPNASQKQEMLAELGHSSIQALFEDIPQNIKIQHLNLPKGLSQQETETHLRRIAQNNTSHYHMPSFLGGGIKPHYIPAAVKSLSSRSEFFTAYTPYQPETSQGFLQAMFEYQSMIAEITGMDIANASLYDGVTALGEAALMCTRVTKKTTFLIPKNISWEKKSVLHNYTKGAGINIVEIPYDQNTGKIDVPQLKQALNDSIAGIYIENPNFFGIFEDNVNEIEELIHAHNALFVVGIDPLSLGIIKNPGEYGADIVIGEGRALGNAMDFGGSSLGLFACKEKYLRQIPGRIIGITSDTQGNQAFCMTMQTREQHIRRGRATSNICTNEGLCALTAAIYLSWLGSSGLTTLGKTNYEQGQLLSEKITMIPGFQKVFSGVHFNEFVLKTSLDSKKIQQKLLHHGIQGGLLLEPFFPELKNCLLFGITELHTNEDIACLLSALQEVN